MPKKLRIIFFLSTNRTITSQKSVVRKSEEEKLVFLNYMIFKCMDNFFVSKDIDKSVYTKEFKKICDSTSNMLFRKGVENISYEIGVCPNFLKMRI